MGKKAMLSVGLGLLLVLSVAPFLVEGRSCISSIPELDSVSMLRWDYNQTVFPARVDRASCIEVYENDSASHWEAIYFPEEDASNETTWFDAGEGFFGRVVAGIDSEGYFSFSEYYADATQSVMNPPEYTLAVAGSGFSKSVTFENNAILGLMPETYCTLEDAWRQDVTAELEIAETSDLVFEVSCVIRNDGSETVSLPGVAPECWHFAVVRQNGCTFIPRDDWLVLTWTEIPAFSQKDFGNRTIDAEDLPDGRYSVIVFVGSGVSVHGFIVMDVEGNDGYWNTSPRSEGCSMEKGDAPGEITVTVMKCCDREDRLEDILVRWDWDGDGEWDTDWSTDKSCTHIFEDAGNYSMGVQLSDTEGATSERWFSAEVTHTTGVSIGLGLMAIYGLCALAAVVVVLVIVMRRRGKDSTGP